MDARQIRKEILKTLYALRNKSPGITAQEVSSKSGLSGDGVQSELFYLQQKGLVDTIELSGVPGGISLIHITAKGIDKVETEWPDEERDLLKAQLDLHKRTLAKLKMKLAKYTELEAPVHLLNQIEDEEQEIAHLEARITALDVESER